MIEHISTSTHALNIAILVLSAFLLGLALYKSAERIQKRILLVELALLFWILFQTTLALNRWYMDQKVGANHLFFPFLFPPILAILLAFTPRGKRLFQGLNERFLILLQTLRFPLGILFIWLSQERQAPNEMTVLGLNFDLCFGFLSMIAFVLYTKLNQRKTYLIAYHALGILMMGIQMALAFYSAAGPNQSIGITQPFYAATHFPFSLAPTVLFGLLLTAHLLPLFPKTESR